MESKDVYKVIGVMSGTSMDGLDIAYCHFRLKDKWRFEIRSAVTLPYHEKWKRSLSEAPRLSGSDLLSLDAAYGNFIGDCCTRFIKKEKIRAVDLIASHGHTIFHQPGKKFTLQIGNGNAIHAATGISVVFDFRSLDVNLGGQGAPLVPMGDRHLFDDYDVCLNLGGIANLSMDHNKRRIAFDICFANMGLNYLAGKAGLALDAGGQLAGEGEVDRVLLKDLARAYDSQRKTRSALAREEFESAFRGLLDRESVSLQDRMRTFCESIADEVARALPAKRNKMKLLATGGGVLNSVLMRLLVQRIGTAAKVTTPPRTIVEFKEALVFAFLGVLRVRGEVNVLKSVTRATRDSCSGVIVGRRS